MIDVSTLYRLQVRFNPEVHPSRNNDWGTIIFSSDFEDIRRQAVDYVGHNDDVIDVRVLTIKTYTETSLERTVDGQETRRAQEDPRVNDNDFF
jgi:hypothetical protein